MASAKKWAGTISYIAGRAYFYLIILQIPLFRVPCKGGICTTPIEVAAGHFVSTASWLAVVVKAILYPGAIFDAILKNKTLPTFNSLLHNYNLVGLDQTFDVQHTEVILGSILSVAGTLSSLRPGRISLLGSFLIVWGIFRDTVSGIYTKTRVSVDLYVTLWFATILAFLSIKPDMKRLIRSFRPRRHKKEKHN